MAADAGTIELNFRARLDQLEKDMASAKLKAGKAADDMGDEIHHRIGSKLSGLGATIGKAAVLGIGSAAVGVGLVLKGAFAAAEESRKVGAQTAAVIASTGGVANVSAAQVAGYADKLAALTGIDDEVIAGGENMLLTFTNVKNRVGEGNDIFNQGTKAALNMSVALGTDMNQASMLVGKALNDPIAGMTALTRSGIQFTDQQKAQVKAMVAAGDTLGAQKIILKELETQFGGSAEAAASPMARLKVVVGNLQEQLGARLLPVVGQVASFLADRLPAAMDRAAAVAGPVFARISSGFGAVVEAFKQGGPGVESEATGFIGVMERIGLAVRSVVDWVVANWPQIQATVTEVLTTVQAVVMGFVDIVLTIWHNFGEQIVSYLQGAFAAAMEIVHGAMEIIQGIVATVTAIIHGDWSAAWEGIKQILAGAWDVILGLVDQSINMMQTAISIGMEILGSILRSAWEGIVNFVASIPGRIIGALGDLAGMLYNSGLGMMRAFADGILAGLGHVLGAVGGVLSKARDLLPFSDAKTGPLSDLTLSGRRLPETFARGIRSSSAIADALSDTFDLVDGTALAVGVEGGGGGSSSGAGSRTINVGPFNVRENELSTEIPRRLRTVLHNWDR